MIKELSKMIKDNYFKKIKLHDSGIILGYNDSLKNVQHQYYSVELMSAGQMYFQQVPGKIEIINYPSLRWQSPEHIYNYGCTQGSSWDHHYITFSGERGKELYYDGFCNLSLKQFIPIKDIDRFVEQFIKIDHIIRHQGYDNKQAIIFLEEILLWAIEEQSSPETFIKFEDKFKAFSEQVHQNLDSDFNLQKIAGSFGMSYSYFRRMFQEYSGVPPHKYIIQARLKRAEKALKYSNESIKEIAYKFNLGDVAQFTKTFKQHYGLPPALYRKQKHVAV